jgi:VWFA-related protein
MRGWAASTGLALTMLGTDAGAQAQGASQPPEPVAAFKAGIDLVRVSAVVRDRKGRFVPDLTARDFEVIDGGEPRTITDFRHEQAPVSVAFLFDVSGSMEARMSDARAAALQVLTAMKPDDETAVYAFDTGLDEVLAFTTGLRVLPSRLSSIRPFGATSLHDAIAQTAERVAARDALRRAVIVLTDGLDTASRLTASEVSGIASSIDVPVYIVGVVPAIDNPMADRTTTTFERSVFTGLLGNLAYWTGGDVFVVSSLPDRVTMARQLIEQLRHQYVMAFESSPTPGWHPLVVRARGRDLIVRARSGYISGRNRPISH